MNVPPQFMDFPVLDAAAGRKVDRKNAGSLLIGLALYPDSGLEWRQRMAHFLAQVLWESGGLALDQERWGPTEAQKRYDTRTDLGNTAAADGDGYTNRGEGPIQLTGGANRRAAREGLIARGFRNVPDFVGTDALLTDPWEGLSAVWYWDSRRLNDAADRGDIVAVTRGVNGGENGLAGRIGYYVRSAFALLGRQMGASLRTDIMAFQTEQKLKVDGIAGENTRAALHAALHAQPGLAFTSPVIKAEWWPSGHFTAGQDDPVPSTEERLAALETAVAALQVALLGDGK